ncbi:MAG: D-glycero-beta-D-manno-heptose 1-phosphate adenylyltransferase [Nitrospirae bacterium]|nr:MAG: D-glycero-beta-D-manno-heptose 1-phosphate adenylyltransferase [Nitrospirota bacterium]
MKGSSEKILTKDKLLPELEERRKSGERIVFTNGCFDILHAGHVEYLEEASKLGDCLVVGLNTDRSVSKIKPGRPVIPEKERARVLAGLQSVDYVVLFDEETPYELIKEIKPDLLVKGGDWTPESIVGADLAGDVRVIPYREGLSTTHIIETIIRRFCK